MFYPYKKLDSFYNDIDYWSLVYTEYKKEHKSRFVDIETILNNSRLFLEENEKYIRGIIHKCFSNIPKIKDEDKRIFHIIDLINKGVSLIKGNNISSVITELWKCTCDVCISLLKRGPRVEALLRRLKKRSNQWQKEFIIFLMSEENITEERVKHCAETKILESEFFGCKCSLHKGRSDGTAVYYLEVSGLISKPYNEKYWIETNRKDLVFHKLESSIMYDYIINKEDFNNLWINTVVCFSDTEVSLLEDLYYHIKDWKNLIEQLPDDEIIKQCRETIILFNKVIASIGSRKAKLLGIEIIIRDLETSIQKLSQSSTFNGYENFFDYFCDNIIFDLPWKP